MDTVGGATGAFLPTGNLIDRIDGISVTCMDVAIPMVIALAEDFGLTGYESAAELDANREFFIRMEKLRTKAGEAMGLKNVSRSVIPKFELLAKARDGGTAAAQYFMPWTAHPTMAVTGAQCLATCLLTPGTVAAELTYTANQGPTNIRLEHATGVIDVLVEYTINGDKITQESAGLVRTARLLAKGSVFVPSQLV